MPYFGCYLKEACPFLKGNGRRVDGGRGGRRRIGGEEEEETVDGV